MASSADERDVDVNFPAEDDLEHLIEDYSHLAPPSEGELLQGHVVKVTPQEIIVDFGYKLEGVVPIEQLRQPDGTVPVRPGDTIDVMIDRHGAQPEGYVLLSYSKASRLRIWDTLERAMREQLLVSGRVIERTKGGLMVDVGVPAFMPGSQVDLRPIHDLDQFIGQDIPVKVLKINRRRGNVVVSRKMAIEEDLKARKQNALQHLFEGAVVTGVVKNLTDYGAFVDLGGIDGLLHVSDMSHGRVNHPSEVVHVGDEITVKVLKFDREKERISLGLRQLTPDPWETLPQRCPPGSRVIGRVMSITDYGAFVEIEPGVEGLIHVSEMTWSRRMKHPSKVVKVGDQVEAVVLEVKPKDRRVSLGIKQLEPDPWTTVAERYSIGSVVEGRVRKLADFGAFLEIEEGVDGLVHVSDLSWTKHVKHPSEVLKKGQVMQAVILNIDAPNRRLSLGIKQLQPDAWESFFRSHEVGDMVRGRVCRACAFGVFVELAPGVEALCHKSEIPPMPSGTPEGESPLPIGEEYDFKIIKMNEADKKIGLSLRAVAEEEERTRLEDYQRQAAAATMTIEEAMSLRGKGER
ncbi:MAG TPA: 30S ribosomal protein S1 [Bryobacteraceae bacterium]|jgi:small subunit ribosomal protein S1|nr:30S ribosomal protein S1 [Bryobacteraceae bacterium]